MTLPRPNLTLKMEGTWYRNSAKNATAGGDQGRATQTHTTVIRERWARFRKVWNGSTFRGRYESHVDENVPESERSKVAVGTEMAQAVADTILPNVPSKPEEGKWTKTPPAISWTANLTLCGSLFPDLVEDAFHHIVIEIADGGREENQKLSFNGATGVRLVGSRELAASLEMQHVDKALFKSKAITIRGRGGISWES